MVRIFWKATVSILSRPYSHRKMTAKGKTYEVHADSGNVALCVGVVGKPKQQAGLSNTRVSDKEKLEKVVVSCSMVRSLKENKRGFQAVYLRRPSWREWIVCGCLEGWVVL